MSNYPRKQCEFCKQWKQLSDYNFNCHRSACKPKHDDSTPSIKSLWKQSKFYFAFSHNHLY